MQLCEQRLQQLYAKQGRTSQFRSKKDRDAFLKKEIQSNEKALANDRQQIRVCEDKLKEFSAETETTDTRAADLSKQFEDFKGVIEASSKKLEELKSERDKGADIRKCVFPLFLFLFCLLIATVEIRECHSFSSRVRVRQRAVAS